MQTIPAMRYFSFFSVKQTDSSDSFIGWSQCMHWFTSARNDTRYLGSILCSMSESARKKMVAGTRCIFYPVPLLHTYSSTRTDHKKLCATVLQAACAVYCWSEWSGTLRCWKWKQGHRKCPRQVLNTKTKLERFPKPTGCLVLRGWALKSSAIKR